MGWRGRVVDSWRELYIMARIDEEAAREADRRLREDCPKLLGLLGKVLNANKGTATDRELYAEGLANKFFNHAFFVLYLSQSPNTLGLPIDKVKLSGVASIDVLTRAAFEAFLTFHYVFYAPKTVEDQNYRYWAYRLAGHMERQGMTEYTDEHKQKLLDEKKAIEVFSNKLNSNPVFERLTRKQKSKVLKGNWKLPSWGDIAKEAGLSGMLASDMYRHLCGYAHSSSLSVLQAKQAYEKHEEELLIEPSIIVTSIVTANIIFEYCELFEKSKRVLLHDQDGMRTVRLWVKAGCGHKV